MAHAHRSVAKGVPDLQGPNVEQTETPEDGQGGRMMDIETEMHECERCDGTGTMLLTGFITRSTGCSAVQDEPMKCLDCQGKGQVSGLQLKMRRIGKHIREWRVETRTSEREQATLLGFSLTEFNKIQHGKLTR